MSGLDFQVIACQIWRALKNKLSLRRIGKQGSWRVKKLVQLAINIRCFREIIRRRKLSDIASLKRLEDAIPQMRSGVRELTSNGFCEISWLPSQLEKEILDEGRSLISSIDEVEREENAPFPHLIQINESQKYDVTHPFVKFALSDAVLGLLTPYFGFVPVLMQLNLMFSPNRIEVPNSSQQMHLDGQGTKAVHVYFFLTNVTKDSGPMTIVDARNSRNIALKKKYRKFGAHKRLTDEEFPRDSILPLLGDAGSIFACDVERCFHFGSRPGAEPRYVLITTYISPFAFGLPADWSLREVCELSSKAMNKLSTRDRLTLNASL